MRIEGLRPIKVTTSAGETLLIDPGQVVDLPDHDARKLLAQAPGRVRPAILPGDMIFVDEDCPLEVELVDTDAVGVTWLLARDPRFEVRWVNLAFARRVNR